MDLDLFLAINGSLGRAAPQLWWLVSELGKGELAALLAVALVVVAERRAVTLTIPAMLGAALLSGGISGQLKDAVARERPLAKLGARVNVVGEELFQRSFPSGHSASASALCVAAGVRRRSARTWAVGGVLAGLVGLSRVCVGAHWPSDVAAGWLLGALCGMGMAWVSLWVERWASSRGWLARWPSGRGKVGP